MISTSLRWAACALLFPFIAKAFNEESFFAYIQLAEPSGNTLSCNLWNWLNVRPFLIQSEKSLSGHLRQVALVPNFGPWAFCLLQRLCPFLKLKGWNVRAKYSVHGTRWSWTSAILTWVSQYGNMWLTKEPTQRGWYDLGTWIWLTSSAHHVWGAAVHFSNDSYPGIHEATDKIYRTVNLWKSSQQKMWLIYHWRVLNVRDRGASVHCGCLHLRPVSTAKSHLALTGE